MAGTASPTSADADVSTAARELYGLPRERFVRERNERERELARAGAREAAAQVKRLRKPTLAAWAIDQAVRDDPDAAEELVETVAALQSRGLPSRMRELAGRHEELVEQLARAASRAAGGGRAADLAAAIRAAVLGPDVQQFVDGCLASTPRADEETLAAALAAGAAATSSPRARAGESRSRDDQRAARRRLRAELTAARAAEREAASAERALSREVARLEQQLEAARGRARDAAEAQQAALDHVAELERAVERARS